MNTEKSVNSSSSAQDAWAAAHGSFKSLARTRLDSDQDGDLIISTAIVSTGHTFDDGFFAGLETRVFGGRCHDLSTFFESTGNPQDAIRKAIKEHSAMVERVVDIYLQA